jgi:hypothetical protein
VQLLGKTVQVKTLFVLDGDPYWTLDKPLDMTIDRAMSCMKTGEVFPAGSVAEVPYMPDEYLMPIGKAVDPGNEWDESELDSERSFEVREPAHA